ncbi:hypothetical protein B0H14DRAFT_3730582 [Mycena olivaceomarginata]|nr:hypothetical protein B0H14DRAFT_3730582 [Mycena olivaceomarginata]
MCLQAAEFYGLKGKASSAFEDPKGYAGFPPPSAPYAKALFRRADRVHIRPDGWVTDQGNDSAFMEWERSAEASFQNVNQIQAITPPFHSTIRPTAHPAHFTAQQHPIFPTLSTSTAARCAACEELQSEAARLHGYGWAGALRVWASGGAERPAGEDSEETIGLIGRGWRRKGRSSRVGWGFAPFPGAADLELHRGSILLYSQDKARNNSSANCTAIAL